MNAATLKELAATAGVGKLDLASTRLLLETHAEDTTVIATYVAPFSAGQRSVPRTPDVPDLQCEVDAARFQQLCALFADTEDVRLRVKGADLLLVSKAHQVKARLYPYDATRLPPDPVAVPIATVPARALLAECERAAAFVARNVAKPMLTGIRLITAGTKLGVQAYNGYSALFTATLNATLDATTTARTAIVVPAPDLLVGLRLIGDADVTLAMIGEGLGLRLRSASAWFRCSTLTGTWTDLKNTMLLKPTTQVTLTADQLRAVTASVRILEAGNDVQITGTDHGIVLQTAKAEAGQYATRVQGDYRGSVWLDVADVLLAQSLGETITLGLASDATIVRAESGHRRVWLTTRTK